MSKDLESAILEDSDYFKCPICRSIQLKSSNPRAIKENCCLDCYDDEILPEELNREDD